VHEPPLAVIIVDGVVQDAAIVPERDRIGLPAEAAGEFGPHCVLSQILQERRAFLFRHVLETHGECRIDIERSAAGLDMSAHDRVLDLGIGRVAKAKRRRRLAGLKGARGIEA